MKTATGNFIKLGVLAVALFQSDPIYATNESSTFTSPQTLKVHSASMDPDIPVLVALPRGYQTTGASYPVVYLLHEADLDEHTWYLPTPVQEMADTYRSIGSRGGRALAGNSMDGRGAMFLAIRHKEVFSATAPMSGGMDIRASHPQVGVFPNNWGIKDRIGSIQAHPERWNELSVINQIESLKDGELAISIDCGADDFLLSVNRSLREKLLARKISRDYIERPGTHGWDYWARVLRYQVLFLNERFKSSHQNSTRAEKTKVKSQKE